jgi:hypothetical protein
VVPATTVPCTHDYPIWATTARALGLTVSTDMPDVVLELMKLYPQPVRTQSGGGVEYLPIPRQKEPRRGQFFDRSRDGHAR